MTHGRTTLVTHGRTNLEINRTNAKMAFAIRFLELHLAFDGDRAIMFQALRELMIDETMTPKEKETLLEVWLARHWDRLRSDFSLKAAAYPAFLELAKAAGLSIEGYTESP